MIFKSFNRITKNKGVTSVTHLHFFCSVQLLFIKLCFEFLNNEKQNCCSFFLYFIIYFRDIFYSYFWYSIYNKSLDNQIL